MTAILGIVVKPMRRPVSHSIGLLSRLKNGLVLACFTVGTTLCWVVVVYVLGGTRGWW